MKLFQFPHRFAPRYHSPPTKITKIALSGQGLALGVSVFTSGYCKLADFFTIT